MTRMPTDIDTDREDRLASVSESGVSLVTKERVAQLQAQLDEERHLLEQERAIQKRNRAMFDRERAELDEKAESLAIEAERLRERTRELEHRESALRQREAAFAKKSIEVTNPRLQAKATASDSREWDVIEAKGARSSGSAQEWELPTVAASLDDALAMMKKLPKRDTPQPAAAPAPRQGGALRQVMLANPVATFSFGFAAATIAMMILWGLL